MIRKQIAEIDDSGRCFHEFDYVGQTEPVLQPSHLDVTGRTDGPHLGKVYDRRTDTWAEPD